MRRVKIKLLLLLAFMLVPSIAGAKLNPLRIITERLTRAEIMIVLDTSGSMAWYPNPGWAIGNDCGGDATGTRDLCGDGMCTGSEGSSINACWTDCNISSPYVSTAGQARSCYPGYALTSRIYMVKRVMRTLLPELRKSAAFGLTDYHQAGYYRYHRATTGSSKQVGVWWSRYEMENIGAWDSTNTKPRNSFTWNGTTYTLLSQATGLTQDADSLYARSDNNAEENRFKFSTGGLTYADGTHNWMYRGSFYVYDQQPTNTGTYATTSEYYGPQYVDSSGVTWVYFRFYNPYTSQGGVWSANTGSIVEGFDPTDTQSLQDAKLYRILKKFNVARNGGIWAWGSTPSGPAIQLAMNHYLERQFGYGYFALTGPDPNATCRGRFVLLLTDGQSNVGVSPQLATSMLYSFTNSMAPGNPVKTVVVGLPGLPSTAVAELDATADYGDNGLADNSATAYTATNETQLLANIKQALFDMVKGDYTTTSAASGTSSSSSILGNVALVPSTEYPGWRGHLKAMDITTVPATELWDAGLELNSMDYKNRRIFTGFPDSNSTIPVPLLDSAGVVNLNGGCPGCVGVKSVWQDAVGMGNEPGDNDIISSVEWVAGKGKSWKLGPIFRSVPAIVGKPPKYYVANHSNFRSTQAARERLIYITSNDGLIHAFRLEDGTEAFAHVPPNLWSKIHALWQQGGQTAVPVDFKWILAASPRVEDIPESCTPCAWKTQLVQTMGPGANAYTALDISSPSTCTATNCYLKNPPFKILAHSRDLKPGIDSYMGETWSAPSLFYAYPTADPEPHMAMGSGYYTGSRSDYYTYFSKIHQTFTPGYQSGAGAQVEYAVLPHTTAAVDYDGARKIVATYQPDPSGKVYRYEEGNPSSGTTVVLNSGTSKPIFQSLAAWHKGSDEVLFAAISGDQNEESPPTNEISTLYIRSETNGTISTDDYLTCDVDDICSAGGTCPDEVPTGCIAPGPTAKPVGPPLILRNEYGTTKQYEIFYVLYEPSTSACDVGDSWLIRISTNGTTQKLMAVIEYAETRATGLTVVGGGLDVLITSAGYGGKAAKVEAAFGNMSSEYSLDNLPYVEVWKEVK